MRASAQTAGILQSAKTSRTNTIVHTVRKLLEDWSLVGEMRRSEGLDLTVSPAGIRLESSN
jgi:hypothetical protein